MTTDSRAVLKNIRTFPSLIRYLRDEMDWPIEGDDFEELTFEYTPGELGIAPGNAAKIQEIKRLRPLSTNQPWGIFFVKFEPKQLPVVALRRILSRVVLKKRESANSAERAAWKMADLLFISNYGQADDRQISLAYFTENKEMGDLPVLKVLGWDEDDTNLHLDHVADELRSKLRWPDEESDVEAWRKTWASAFTLRHHEVITTSKRLAVRLAELARAIRMKANAALAIESDLGPLRQLMAGFQKALIHDLTEDGFADMYAQTVAYGLLSARISRPTGLVADDMANLVPVTNPFLKELLESFMRLGGRRRGAHGNTGIDFDELGINEVVQLLRDANMEAVVRDFGDRNPQEDPVIHFYELFLTEYDAKKRMQRGVFYTPRPVVSYIVRSVHELLQSEFGLADGLADTATWGEMAQRHKGLTLPEGVKTTDRFVTILDPATGTGTFLVEVIEVIHRTMTEKWRREGQNNRQIADLWNEYVPEHLLPRLHGYELLMAPYAIAHLKIGLKLSETGYGFGSDERARIYLTNALEPAQDFSGQFEFAILALAHESEAVNEVKRQIRFTVVIGNPPYSIVSQNSSTWLSSLMDIYKHAVRAERNIQPLSDDYLKFLRLGHFLIECARFGILSLITNHTYLTGVIHRGIREELLKSFDSLSLFDLHGSALLGLKSPNGEADENVFDIQQGVSIAALVRKGGHGAFKRVHRADLWGLREHKYQVLSGSLPQPKLTAILPTGPFFFFAASTSADEIYEMGISVADMFERSSAGFVTGRDEALVSFERERIVTLVEDLADSRLSDKMIAARYNIDNTSGWPVTRRRREIVHDQDRMRRIIPIAYRPFDDRFTYYSDFLQRSRYSVFRHLLMDNIALISSRLVKGEEPAHFFVTRLPTEKIFLSPKTSNNAFIFPLYEYPERSQFNALTLRRPAINRKCARQIAKTLGLTWWDDRAKGTMDDMVLKPEELFRYVYGVLYSTAFRIRYGEFLKIDFPRIPIPGNLDLFREVARTGGELVALHLMESPKLGQFVTSYSGPINPLVRRVGWSDNTVWLDAGRIDASEGRIATSPGSIGFKGIPKEIWNFRIGGYQVCHKWLKDRNGRNLSNNDIEHYQKIIVALKETIRLVQEIDEVIEAHGGWPDAFQTNNALAQEEDMG